MLEIHCIKNARNRDGSSLFFLARVEPEPIFFRSGQALATDWAYAGQNISVRAYFEPQKYQWK